MNVEKTIKNIALTIGAERRGEPLKINGLTCTDGICIGVN